jgi:hypothetical protein
MSKIKKAKNKVKKAFISAIIGGNCNGKPGKFYKRSEGFGKIISVIFLRFLAFWCIQ